MTAYRTAMHESRHAIAALTCGFEVEELWLAPDGEAGHCIWQAPASADIHDTLMVCLAGLSGDQGEFRSHSDIQQAGSQYDRWMRQHGPAAPFETQVQQWLQDCRMALLPEGATITKVAHALLESGRLTSTDLDDVLGYRPSPRVAPLSPAHSSTPRRSAPVSVSQDTKAEDAMVRAFMGDLAQGAVSIMLRNMRQRTGKR